MKIRDQVVLRQLALHEDDIELSYCVKSPDWVVGRHL